MFTKLVELGWAQAGRPVRQLPTDDCPYNNTGIPGVPRVLGPVSELWDGSLNSGVGTPEFWGTSDAFCVVLA